MTDKNKVLWEKEAQSLGWIDREESLRKWLVNYKLECKEGLGQQTELELCGSGWRIWIFF